jgi:hypothetical protein
MADVPTSARKGKAVEHLVAASCILASGSRLNALTGVVDDEGVDITFKRRNGFRTLDVQVKSAFLESRKNLRDKGRFIADTRHATFGERDDLYFLFVVVDGLKAEFGPVWLVPSDVLADKGLTITVNGKKLLRFNASAKPTSRDKWSDYRLGRDQLTPRILEVLSGLQSSRPQARSAST